jgi:hypothetical protein
LNGAGLVLRNRCPVVAQFPQVCPSFHGNRNFIAVFTIALSGAFVAQQDSVYTLTPCFLKNCSNVEENFSFEM